jgi:hypothetical protein
MALMVNEIRMAGFDPTERGGFGLQMGTGVDVTGPHSIHFTLDMNTRVSADECVDGPDGESTGCNEVITYFLNDSGSDGDLDLMRRVHNKTDPAVENVTSLDFCYFLESAPNGPCTSTPTAAELDQIRAVQVTLTTQTENPDPKYTNPQNGTGYRTATLTAVVQIRNLGLKRG